MSHNYPYRRPPAPKDPRVNSGSYDRSDHLHSGDRNNLYKSSQEPPSHSTITSYCPSSSRASAATSSTYSSSSSLGKSEQTLNLLSSCGLEPKDLSLLAEMPADLITVENLPSLLREIRKKRMTPQPSYLDTGATTSYPHGNTSGSAAVLSPGRAWEQCNRSRSQQLDYPPGHQNSLPPSQPFPREQGQVDRPGNPMQYTSSRVEPVPVQVVDYNYGKKTTSNYEPPRPTYSTSQPGTSSSRNHPIPSQTAVDYRYPLPTATDYVCQSQDVLLVAKKMSPSSGTPTKKAAFDFHGEIPQTFPYMCSLCDITVFSEKFWSSHVNGTQHADGQLTLLQMYPKWDCRMQTAKQDDDHSDIQRFDKKTGKPSHRSSDYLGKPSSSDRKNKDANAKATTVKKGSGKVVCAKFPAQCLNEDGLRNLIKQFGEVVKIIMFPALAFVEMGSTNQAEDLVKYYLDNPALVKGGQVTFSVSSTFNFLQSSKVLRFSPVPAGVESTKWKPELLSVAECFGPVEHSLFLPTQAFVEMTNSVDAQKLVEHHTAKPLKISGTQINVAFSSEYNTLRTISMKKSSDRMSPANRKSEDRFGSKRTLSPKRRSLIPNRESSTSPKRRKSRERDSRSHKERAKSGGGGKSRSRSPTDRHGRRSYRSPGFHKIESVSGEKTPFITDPDDTTSSHRSSSHSRPPFKKKTPPQPSTVGEKSHTAVVNHKQETEDISEEEDSQSWDMGSEIEGVQVFEEDEDIEGMAVYGEDGVENSEMREEEECPESPEKDVQEMQKAQEKVQLEEEKKQEDKNEHPCEDTLKDVPPEVALCPEEGKLEASDRDLIQDSPDFPEDFENLVTLDDLEDVSSNDGLDDHLTDESKNMISRSDQPSGRVIYIKNLPRGNYTDADFVKIVKGYGKVHRYLILYNREEGFIEMERSTDAAMAIKDLCFNGCKLNGQKLIVMQSIKYKRLTRGSKPESDSDYNSDHKKECTKNISRTKSEQTRSHLKSTAKDENSRERDDMKTDKDTKPGKKDDKTENVATEEKKTTGNDKTTYPPEKTKGHCALSAEPEKMGKTKPGEVVETGPDSMTGNETSFKANNPVGREFVKPVVGYFCNLCKVIYADEDEAKNEHCSSPSHYQKFMEFSRKDMASD
ncbi:hypothetical protein DPEC_G00022380 [Dallia pectoralis]|uniref:Uncharacterized protein n=1 Tax=Dallia pectoralis TaxID=75939 RepID=A0ACC2HGJ3_DALPE|nr:hypothetical protein DPEC_G00022380 [Dallia pectoralis]